MFCADYHAATKDSGEKNQTGNKFSLQEVDAHMKQIYGAKRARTAIFAESADQLALEAAAAADDAAANGVLPSVSPATHCGAYVPWCLRNQLWLNM